MRALVFEQLGPLETGSIQELPSVALTAGQVRVQVTASGVNFVDSLMSEGRYQIKAPVPFTPGGEIVGLISETAPDVTNLKIGDRVFVPVGLGGFASEVVTQAQRAVVLPDSLSDGQAATFMQSYMTAWFAFTVRVPLEAGRTILVLGAGGGIGLAAVDVAHSMGVRVIAAASSAEKLALASARGAFATINTSTENTKDRAKEISGGGVDYLYDPVGGELGETCLRALGEDGNYIVIGFVAGIPRLPANQVLLRNRRVTGVDWGAWVGRHQEQNRKLIVDVLSAISAGTLNPVEPIVYALDDAVQAMRDLQERRIAGKAVLIP
ncbi:MAG: NADPH:quinone oxidoreductase family protein [Ilumatobacteraceae bacterium]|nr:NADPH:quinone oxidoreductase family protein [Ilumatobacteraceae bacterium]